MATEDEPDSGPDEGRGEAITEASRAVRLLGLTERSEVRAALIHETTTRGVENLSERELDELVDSISTPVRTGLRALRDQTTRKVGRFRELRTYAEPRWALPPRDVPSPPEPDLSSAQLSVRLTSERLTDARALIQRVIEEVRDRGDVNAERDLTPWLSTAPDGVVSIYLGRELLGVIGKENADKFAAAIDRWGGGTHTLSMHATLFGTTADNAELTVFVNLPPAS